MEQNGVLRPPAADLPLEVRDLARFLRTLMTSLGARAQQRTSWTLNDPEAMEHYLDGTYLPPRDVVISLLRDLADRRGERLTPETERQARDLHARAVRVVDDAPGRVAELRAELNAMDTAVRRIARREQQLLGDVRAQQAAVQGGAVGHAEYRRQLITIHGELRRVREQRSLAETRRGELAERLEQAEHLDDTRSRRQAAPDGHDARDPRGHQDGRDPADGVQPGRDPGPRPGPAAAGRTDSDPARAQVPRLRVLRRSAARGTGRDAQRARHPQAPGDVGGPAPTRAALAQDPAARELVGSVLGLRAAGRPREAQQLLWTASAWPPERFPALLAALAEAGQGGDAAVVLWELSSRAPREVAACCAWLALASLHEECRELLDHASSRSHGDVAALAVGLAGAGWHRQARVLLVNTARLRPPQVVAGLAGDLAAAESGRLLRELLAAVAEVPRERQLLIAAAMRTAGLPQTAADVRG
ncbi:hypothetical protein AQ490_27215 [Wenjunlia vitaminophila]|uniref:Uncharacterized protein n=1 Tax=Wenjunlia vitaminophila TaxID=76728 RepID=A0A0T6LPK0_WENVI|nr:hypothetical protein [Wenjunlia vitaminophila]KRV48023.1 hypothetical protein AQ490_27215 [Wenjunlia vitaminophila]